MTHFAGDFRASPGAAAFDKRSDGAFPLNGISGELSSFTFTDGASEAIGRAKPRIRLPISYRGLAGLVASLDFLIIIGSALLSGAFYDFTAYPGEEEFSRTMAAAVFVAVLFISATAIRKYYDPSRLTNWNEQLRYVIGAWCGTFFLMASGVFAWGVGKELSRETIILFWAVGGVGLLVHRALWRVYLPAALSSGALKGRNAIVISWDEPMNATLSRSMSQLGYAVIAQLVVSTNSDQTAAGLKSVVNFARGALVDDIFLIPKNRHSVGIGAVIDTLRVLPIPVTLVPDAATAELIRNPSYELGSQLAVEIQRPPLSWGEQMFKRVFDIIFASIALIAVLPLLIIVSIAIAIDSPGPVLFRQTRHSFNGQPFKIFKFRTMSVLEDGEVIGQAKIGDQRVTRIGNWLRRSSIDELPQLLNVLRGEMSIVGPRPHAAAHDRYFEKFVENYAFRHHVKSGITGWAQVNGARGETNTVEKIQTRVDLDLWYITHWSPQLDFSILLRTIGVVLKGKNAF